MTFNVSQVVSYVNQIIKSDFLLQDLEVEGEVSGFRLIGTNIFFDLKDNMSIISCYYPVSQLKNEFKFEDGKKIIVKGQVRVFSRNSKLQLYVSDVKEIGLGALFENFLILKNKLENEGLFDRKYKKEITKFPSKIGLVTSLEGAAINDYLISLNKKYRGIDIYLCKIRVQGKSACSDIINALNILDEKNLDYIVITRGGGSLEDLNIFNDENLVRQIFKTKTPIVSAIGHEENISLTDLVADITKLTPTDAGLSTTADFNEILIHINRQFEHNKKIIFKNLENKKLGLINIYNKILLYNPKNKIIDFKKDTQIVNNKIFNSLKNKINKSRKQLSDIYNILNKNNYMDMFDKGFAFITLDENKIRDIKDININDVINVVLKNGSFRARIIEKERKSGL